MWAILLLLQLNLMVLFVLSDLPSDVYKITVTHPTGANQTINNYAVWPSSGSSYVFVAK